MELLEKTKCIEDLLVSENGLDQIEQEIGAFNIFEALGSVNRELHHSNFLSYLMDPFRPHGIGDFFLKKFLKKIVGRTNNSGLSVVDIDTTDFSAVEVYREYHHVDILVLHRNAKIVIAIENKINSLESKDQTARYADNIYKLFPGYKVLFIFLSKNCDKPQSDKWIATDYGVIRETIQSFLSMRSDLACSGIRFCLEQYQMLIERHFMESNDVVELCRRVYAQHKEAFDLVFEHRPDHQTRIAKIIEKLIKDTPNYVFETSNKSILRFSVPAFEAMRRQQTCNGDWGAITRVLLFEVFNKANGIVVKLIIGPSTDSEFRELLFNRANEHPKLHGKKKLTDTWTQIYRYQLFTQRELDDLVNFTDEEIEGHLTQRWTDFVVKEILDIEDAFKDLDL